MHARVAEAAPELVPAARADVVGERIETLRRVVAEAGGGGALIWTRRTFAWLTLGGQNHVLLASETGVAPILVTPDRAIVFAPVNERARLEEEELAGLPLEVVTVGWHETGGLQADAERIAGGRLLGDDELEPAIQPLRSVLGPIERARLAWLGARAGAALEAARQSVGPGAVELDVAADLASELGRSGIRAPVVLVASDERIDRFRHPLPTAAAASRRMMIVLVAERWGLHVATTTFAELEPRSRDLARRFDAVAEIGRAFRDATRSGATLGQALAAGRVAYRRVGFADEWQLHHQGGTIGYQSRERIAVPNDPTVIESGMAFAWNPSITGAKTEETFLLTEDGSVSITGAAIP
jgi:Xaa-Pro dipeptidase